MCPHHSDDDDQLDRTYDVKQGFRRFVLPAICVYFVLGMGVYGLMGRLLPAETRVLLLVSMGGILALFTVGWAIRAQQRQMANTHIGYAAQERGRPMFVIGSREYTRYRVDEGNYTRGRRNTTGFSPWIRAVT